MGGGKVGRHRLQHGSSRSTNVRSRARTAETEAEGAPTAGRRKMHEAEAEGLHRAADGYEKEEQANS